VSFSVGADEYDRFMGRYSLPLAPRSDDFVRVAAGTASLILPGLRGRIRMSG